MTVLSGIPYCLLAHTGTRAFEAPSRDLALSKGGGFTWRGFLSEQQHCLCRREVSRLESIDIDSVGQIAGPSDGPARRHVGGKLDAMCACFLFIVQKAFYEPPVCVKDFESDLGFAGEADLDCRLFGERIRVILTQKELRGNKITQSCTVRQVHGYV